MSDDLDQVFPDGDAVAMESAAPEQAEQTEAPQEAANPSPVEAEAPKEAGPEADPEVKPEDAAKPEAEDAPRTVPLKTLLEERTERQKLQARLAEYEQKEQAKPAPDMFSDPEGYQKHMAEQLQQVKASAVEQVSMGIAVQTHGQEAVDNALAELQGRPDHAVLAQHLMSQPSPYTALVEWHKREQALQEIGDPATYKERLTKEITAQVTAQMAKQKTAATPSAPSMAGFSGTGGGVKSVSIPTDLESLFPD